MGQRYDIKTMDDRKNEIPDELADVKLKLGRLSEEKKVAEDALSEYRTLLDSLIHICSKYSLENSTIFSGRLKSVLQEEIEMTGAKIRKHGQDKQSLEERLTAAKEGHVHILPDIMKYVMSTGVWCQTGEEYITGLMENGAITQEKARDKVFFEGYMIPVPKTASKRVGMTVTSKQYSLV